MSIHANTVTVLLRALTWICMIILAVLSLLPATDMVSTGLPDTVNHFVAYAGSAAIAMAAYQRNRGGVLILFAICGYAAILEYLQHFAPGREPGVEDFVASALGTLCGGTAAAIVWPRLSRMLIRP